MPPVQIADRSGLVREPVYQQLNGLLKSLIQKGEYVAGDKFPTEREVGERFGVSRITANKSLSSLVSEGVLEFRKGVGTFVRDLGMDYDLHSLMSFTRKAELSGKFPETRVLSFVTMKASACEKSLCDELKVDPSEMLHYVERLRLADGVPMILERRYIVARHCAKLTERQLAGSLYTVFTQDFGLILNGASQTLRATKLSAKDSGIMGIKKGDAVLWVRAMGSCQHGPLWFEDTLYHGDLYEFQNTIGSDRAQHPARPALVHRLLSPS